jgi:hypothetical protein
MEKATAKTIRFSLLCIHPVLFLLFFLLKIYNNYNGLVDAKWAVASGWKLLLIVVFFFLLSVLIFREFGKAAIFCSALEILYLFFRPYREFLQSMQYWLGKYSIILPLMFVLVIILLFVLKRVRHVARVNLFLCVLALVYISVEVYSLFANSSKQHNSLFNSLPLPEKSNSGSGPALYYIVLDGYPGPDETGNKVSNIYSSLSNLGFFTVTHARSNYNATVFSTAATLNLQYISAFHSSFGGDPSSYLKAMNDIKHAPMINFFKKQGYAVINLSIFDLENEHSIEKEHFIKVPPADVFFYPTLWYAARRDIFWNVYSLLHKRQDQEQAAIQGEKKLHEGKLAYNERILDSLGATPLEKDNPAFVFAHLYMPHYPYFFDSLGKRYPDELTYERNIYTKDRFLNYVSYTEKRIIPQIEKIIRNTNGECVIIVQSDHGFPGLSNKPNRDFKNISAYYFPDRDYRNLNDSLTNVNTFRIILNKYFGESLPILRDSTFFIPN